MEYRSLFLDLGGSFVLFFGGVVQVAFGSLSFLILGRLLGSGREITTTEDQDFALGLGGGDILGGSHVNGTEEDDEGNEDTQIPDKMSALRH